VKIISRKIGDWQIKDAHNGRKKLNFGGLPKHNKLTQITQITIIPS
jgi:hypothetical protein